MPAGTGDDRQLQLFTILHIKKRSVRYRILRSYKDTPHGPSDWNRTSGLLNPILSPRLFVAENKKIMQLFGAFAIFRIVFISYFPYIPLAFRLYSASVAGEERVTTRPSLERILLHPLSNIRKLAHQYKQSLFGKDGFVGNQR